MNYLLILIGILAIAIGQQAHAIPATELHLRIAPRECTVDTLNTGVSQSTTLQPEACQPLVKKSDGLPVLTDRAAGTIPTQLASAVVASRDVQPGDQGMFENSIAEPLAAWLGVGVKEAPPPVRLAVASAAFVTVMGVVIDAGFFGLGYTQAIWSGLRRTTGRSIYALLRVFFPR